MHLEVHKVSLNLLTLFRSLFIQSEIMHNSRKFSKQLKVTIFNELAAHRVAISISMYKLSVTFKTIQYNMWRDPGTSSRA